MRQRSDRLDRGHWIEAAKDALIHRGIDALRPEALAEALGVEADEFARHFATRDDLIAALMDAWEGMSLGPVGAVDKNEDLDPFLRFERFMEAWVASEPYFPVYDAAIRLLARLDDNAASRVAALDDRRIALLTGLFRELGHEDEEAFIRARIAYFQQIGYYALGIKESSERRRHYWPLYVWILTGR